MTEPVTKIEKCEPAAHTPGPWTSVDDSESSDLFDGIKFVIEGPPERQRGRVVVGQIATCNGERAKANARLIAQAPALLSHVEKSLCWMIGERNCYYEGCANPGSGYVHDADDRAVLDSLDRDIDELRALIAAARGGSMTDPITVIRKPEEIRIDRDPRLCVKEGHDAIEFALMHPSHFSRHHIAKLEYARQVIARVMEEL